MHSWMELISQNAAIDRSHIAILISSLGSQDKAQCSQLRRYPRGHLQWTMHWSGRNPPRLSAGGPAQVGKDASPNWAISSVQTGNLPPL